MGYNARKNSDTWILYLGSFLGAGITLLGIKIQLENERKEVHINKLSNTISAYNFLENEIKIFLTSYSDLLSAPLKANKNISVNDLANKLTYFISKSESELKGKALSEDIDFKKAAENLEKVLEDLKNKEVDYYISKWELLERYVYEESIVYTFIYDSLPKDKLKLMEVSSRLKKFIIISKKTLSTKEKSKMEKQIGNLREILIFLEEAKKDFENNNKEFLKLYELQNHKII